MRIESPKAKHQDDIITGFFSETMMKDWDNDESWMSKCCSLVTEAVRLEAIAIRLEAIAIRLEVLAIGLEAIAIRLEAIAF